LAAALAVASLATACLAYPHYFPFVNSLGMGRPAYDLVGDSNVDWNEALPEAQQFAAAHGLRRPLLDEYGFSDATVYVPGAVFWDCQNPAPEDAGQWAVVSGSMIRDGHNCLWLMQYPHQALAAGGMYAFQLPQPIPPVGSAGGPPPFDQQRNFGGLPPGPDLRLIFLDPIRDPKRLPEAVQRMQALFTQAQTKKN
jgi:hypothetical protein